MKAALLPLAAALALVLAQEPAGVLPLAFLGLAPLAAFARAELPPRRRFLAAYAGGLCYFAVGCRWLAVTSPINLALMTIAEALSFPAFVALLRLATPRRTALGTALAVPLAWCGVEALRAHWPWNGFPWLLLGNALTRPLELAQAAEWFGAFGLSFAAALASGLVAAAWQSRARRPAAVGLAAAAAAIPFALYAYGSWRIPAVRAAESTGPRVAAVQANVPQELKRGLAADEIDRMQMEGTAAAVRAAGPRGFDLLCWAETMFVHHLGDGAPGDIWFEDGAFRYGMKDAMKAEDVLVRGVLAEQVLRPMGAALLVGVRFLEGPSPGLVRDHNAAVLFDADGRRRGVYKKSLLVPGGEFVPLRDLLPDAVDDLIRSIAGFVPGLTAGPGPAVLSFRARDGVERTFAATICYENAYPGYAARIARLGVDFVVNLSNEAWFGASSEFDQMDAASRLRAIEMRRSLVRATNSGISALYDATGARRVAVTDAVGRDRAVAGALVADVPLYALAATPFAAVGDRFHWALAAAAAVAAAVGSLRKRRYQAVAAS